MRNTIDAPIDFAKVVKSIKNVPAPPPKKPEPEKKQITVIDAELAKQIVK